MLVCWQNLITCRLSEVNFNEYRVKTEKEGYHFKYLVK